MESNGPKKHYSGVICVELSMSQDCRNMSGVYGGGADGHLFHAFLKIRQDIYHVYASFLNMTSHDVIV